jgi:hypothetical protein
MKGKMVYFLLAFVMIVGISGDAFTYGGHAEPGSCEVEPSGKITGPYVMGTFTVARDKMTLISENKAHYNVQFLLKHGREVHLFSFTAELLPDDSTEYIGDCYETHLCDVEESDLTEWSDSNNDGIAGFGHQPCQLGVGEAFGMEGTPVIVDLKITERDFCGCENAMIAGTVVIGFVPPEE